MISSFLIWSEGGRCKHRRAVNYMCLSVILRMGLQDVGDQLLYAASLFTWRALSMGCTNEFPPWLLQTVCGVSEEDYSKTGQLAVMECLIEFSLHDLSRD